MKRPKMKSLATGRLGYATLVLGMSGGLLLGATGVAQAAVGSDPGGVNLVPATGSTSSTPTWSTNVGCPNGFNGSAVFRAVFSDGKSTESISKVNNNVTAAFTGTLQESLNLIQSDSGVANGGTQELVVVCFSGASLTGSSEGYQDIYVTYNANGTYSTSTSGTTVPVGEVGGPIIAGVAALGLVGLQLRRRRSRRTQVNAA